MDKVNKGYLRVAGVAGIAFAAIILLVNAVIFVPAGLPTTGTSADDVTEFFETGGAAITWGSLFLPAAWMLATVFAAGIHAAATRVGNGWANTWSLVGLVGVISQNITIVAVSAIRLALSATAATSRDDVPTMWAMHDALFTLNGTFLAMALVGLSLSGRRVGIIPAWHAAVGLVASALQFASAVLTPFVMAEGGPLGLIGLTGWLLWVGWLVAYGVFLITAAARLSLKDSATAAEANHTERNGDNA